MSWYRSILVLDDNIFFICVPIKSESNNQWLNIGTLKYGNPDAGTKKKSAFVKKTFLFLP